MSHPKRNVTAPRSRQTGVGLIEVLIAALILSIGMLGLASLQLWTLKNNQSSLERGLAVVQTHSIVDALHADRATAMAGGFNVAPTAATPGGATFNVIAITAWRTNLVNALGPNAKGGIDCNGSACTITVIWDDQSGMRDSTTIAVPLQVQTQVQI